MFVGFGTPSGYGVRIAGGVIVGGELTGIEQPGKFDLLPGGLLAASASKRWTLGDGTWFVTGSVTIAGGTTKTKDNNDERTGFTAYDARAGAIAGKTFAQQWSPYVLARAFGGPVSWTVNGDDVTGTDTSHYQLGVGLSMVTKAGLTVGVDLSLLGERSAALAVSWRR